MKEIIRLAIDSLCDWEPIGRSLTHGEPADLFYVRRGRGKRVAILKGRLTQCIRDKSGKTMFIIFLGHLTTLKGSRLIDLPPEGAKFRAIYYPQLKNKGEIVIGEKDEG